MKRICLVGQFPPPIHGLSKALQTIIDSKYFNEKFDLSFVDITNNKKIAGHLGKVEQIDADVYYFTISHSKFGNLRDMFILWRLLRKKKKVVIHYHGGYYKELYKRFNPLQRLLNKKLISRIDVMIVLSKRLQDLFDDVLIPQKVRICENCIEDESLLSELEFKRKLSLLAEGKNRLEILYLSNFIKSKGYFELLRAAKALRSERVVFHFAGKFFNETDKAEFFNYVKHNGLEGYVQYHGIVSGDAKKDLLSRSDVFALPTYYPIEGQPISIIEAMGNGLTIISTNHAGIPDIVSSDNGYLVKQRSPEEIVTVVKNLLADNRKLIDFANENRRTALAKFKEIDYIKRLEVIMDEV
ncbi:glycosyltransferase family 4 protein [Paenibacillus mendelii]|uniref:Glycosyltransferase family 4 protein n=1 Tax=Paenibacillus mendelii TaxID=206163 RepID=A0ABV6JJJ5_9BACL|nr:glycosyltransferase family 4 protein [Paenibacillus mendelii]MCQ6558896.1 glycosyltransferase family 4 protein [Paenibacillus mendelii]